MSSRLPFPHCPNSLCRKHEHPHWSQHGIKGDQVKTTRYRCGHCGRSAKRIYHTIKGGQYFVIELSHGHMASEINLVRTLIDLVANGNNVETPRPSQFSEDVCIYRLYNGEWKRVRHSSSTAEIPVMS